MKNPRTLLASVHVPPLPETPALPGSSDPDTASSAGVPKSASSHGSRPMRLGRSSVKFLAPLLVLWALLASGGRAASPEPIAQPATVPDASVHFRAVDVFVNAGDKTLGAYQVELKARDNATLLVGIEGGEHPAYKSAPYYDPAALMHDRVIVAAFSTAADLPHGNTRVARLMVQTTGAGEPVYDGKIEAAAAADGSPISAQLTVTPVLEGAKQ